MTCISKALIVGGGIAGLSSAIALGRAGVECEVLEIAASPLGASLGISGRAANALDDLGVYDDCAAVSTVWSEGSEAGFMRSAGGAVIAKVERPTWPGAKTALGVYRPALLEVLTRAAEAHGARIRKGVTASEIDFGASGPRVRLSTGETGAWDLVIGADGVWSKTREQMFPEAPRPQYAGQMSIRWMAPGAAVPDEGMYVSPAGRIGFYYLPQDLVYVAAVIAAPEPIRPSKAELHTLFDRLLSAFPAPAIAELRRRLTPQSELVCRPFEWVLVPRPWREGLLLIGDAAHATTAHMGMGGGMAIEDAVVLGQCVAAASTLDDAIAGFLGRRFDRVRTVVETSVAISRGEQAGAPPSERMKLMSGALLAIAEPY